MHTVNDMHYNIDNAAVGHKRCVLVRPAYRGHKVAPCSRNAVIEFMRAFTAGVMLVKIESAPIKPGVFLIRPFVCHAGEHAVIDLSELRQVCNGHGEPVGDYPRRLSRTEQVARKMRAISASGSLASRSAAVSDCALPSSVSGVLLQPPRTEPSSAP